jgi:hypothetical protein
MMSIPSSKLDRLHSRRGLGLLTWLALLLVASSTFAAQVNVAIRGEYTFSMIPGGGYPDIGDPASILLKVSDEDLSAHPETCEFTVNSVTVTWPAGALSSSGPAPLLIDRRSPSSDYFSLTSSVFWPNGSPLVFDFSIRFPSDTLEDKFPLSLNLSGATSTYFAIGTGVNDIWSGRLQSYSAMIPEPSQSALAVLISLSSFLRRRFYASKS